MVRSSAADEQGLERLTGLFKLLSDKTRLNILMLLADGERNVTSICEQLHLPQPTVSHHLSLLRVNNIIANRRNGKQIFYTLSVPVNASDPGSVKIGTEAFNVQISAK
ncbi:MAG TPA: metalloregulator ArsR/SmtB family transcription factor [Tepidisphaeraceae bacterium]|nr:metalloregulator ArsR/SmtB family transcription factor [Tepidisphaeraceae bacterium]